MCIKEEELAKSCEACMTSGREYGDNEAVSTDSDRTGVLRVKGCAKEHKIDCFQYDTVDDVIQALAQDTSLEPSTVSLLCSGKRYTSATDGARDAKELLHSAKQRPVFVTGSSAADVASVRNHKELRIRDFRQEQQRSALRSQPLKKMQFVHPPVDVFGELRPIEAPGWPDTRSFLQQLACRESIVHTMRNRKYKVGALVELPPTDGAVGVDDACKLGLNKGAGSEIHLRLVTDDGQSMRKERSVVQVLAHELAHIEHSDHNTDFKALNSAILAEIDRHDAASSSGVHFAGEGEAASFRPEYEDEVHYAASRDSQKPVDPREAARYAAMRRLQNKE